jgi:hypothetical protein
VYMCGCVSVCVSLPSLGASECCDGLVCASVRERFNCQIQIQVQVQVSARVSGSAAPLLPATTIRFSMVMLMCLQTHGTRYFVPI